MASPRYSGRRGAAALARSTGSIPGVLIALCFASVAALAQNPPASNAVSEPAVSQPDRPSSLGLRPRPGLAAAGRGAGDAAAELIDPRRLDWFLVFAQVSELLVGEARTGTHRPRGAPP